MLRVAIEPRPSGSVRRLPTVLSVEGSVKLGVTIWNASYFSHQLPRLIFQLQQINPFVGRLKRINGTKIRRLT